MLRAVSELDMALPEGKVRPAGRKFKLDNVGDRELLEEIGRFCLMNAHTTSACQRRLSIKDRDLTHPDGTASAKNLPSGLYWYVRAVESGAWKAPMES